MADTTTASPFAVTTILISVSYAWLYNSTKGSLLTVSLYHATINSVNYVFFTEQGITHSVFTYYLLMVAVLTAALILLFKPNSLSRSGRATLEE